MFLEPAAFDPAMDVAKSSQWTRKTSENCVVSDPISDCPSGQIGHREVPKGPTYSVHGIWSWGAVRVQSPPSAFPSPPAADGLRRTMGCGHGLATVLSRTR